MNELSMTISRCFLKSTKERRHFGEVWCFERNHSCKIIHRDAQEDRAGVFEIDTPVLAHFVMSKTMKLPTAAD